ncbi:hypothetical protein R3P38DRAFT_3146139 [Favolaschia claudopus]|uniref:Uncharacterized protein n=1 Tax=Favolaschia claudopus TaxID=2862362 RepID=A0AAV9Z333_9AGAR
MPTVDRVLSSSPASSVFSAPSRANTYETSSGSSSSTVPGPGALSGKAIKALGRVTIRGIDRLVMTRQLSVIAHYFPLPDEKAVCMKHAEEMYADALEFSRQGLYREHINRRALRLLLGQIGMGETQYLVRALSRWDRLELRLFVAEILIQLAPLWNPCLSKVLSSPLLSAYSSRFKSDDVSLCPLLLFISKLIRTKASVCRAVLDVGLLDVLMLVRSLNNLNTTVILSAVVSPGASPDRKRLLSVSNAVLHDILAYPELRSVVQNHPICSTWVMPRVRASAEIVPLTSRERTLLLTSEQDIPDDESNLYLVLDLPRVAALPPIPEVTAEALIHSLAFSVEFDQSFRVFLVRSQYEEKVALFDNMFQHMVNHSSSPAPFSTPSSEDTLRTRYRLLFFLHLIKAVAWSPSNRAALLDAGVIDFLVHIVRREVPESYFAILGVDQEARYSGAYYANDHVIIEKERGLGLLLNGPLAKTSRLVGLISAAFEALFPGDISPAAV